MEKSLNFCPIEGSTPQQKLWRRVIRRWLGQAKWEYRGAVPGRRHRIDIAFPSLQLAVEVDGWQYHGRHKQDFRRDREKQKLLTLNGWHLLRIPAGDIEKNIEGVLGDIEATIAAIEKREKHVD